MMSLWTVIFQTKSNNNVQRFLGLKKALIIYLIDCIFIVIITCDIITLLCHQEYEIPQVIQNGVHGLHGGFYDPIFNRNESCSYVLFYCT